MSLSPTTTHGIVSVAAIIKNDSDILETAIHDILSTLQAEYTYFELLLIDNGSIDDSVEKIAAIQKTKPNIRLIVLSKEYDEDVAYTAALDASIGDALVLMDISKDPHNRIPELVAKIHNGSDIVIAERNSRLGQTLLYRLLSRSFYQLYGGITGFTYSPNATNFRALSRRVVNAITRIRSKGRYLKHFNALVGFSQSFVTYDQIERRAVPRPQPGFTSQLLKAVNLLISHSLWPLRLATITGFIAGTLNLVFILYVFVVSVIKENIAEGYVSSTIVSSTMFFFLFFILMVISEYIAQILIESKNEPLYFIADEYQSNIMSAAKDKRNVV